jgi:hypothetical protein
MDEQFLKLTNVAYRMLSFFPESDPLTIRAKQKALSIMDGLTLLHGTDGWASFQKEKVKVETLADIDSLLGYFWLAKNQGWLSHTNCLIIVGEYEKVKKQIVPAKELLSPASVKPAPPSASYISDSQPPKASPKKEPVKKQPESSLSDRQQKIIAFLEKNDKAQVMDLQKVLPGVTKRTIRRDVDQLLQLKKLERMGEFNTIFYRIGQGRT